MKIPMSRMPGTSQLFRDYLEDFDKVSAFYNGDFHLPETFLSRTEEVKARDLPLAKLIPLLARQNQQFGCGQQTLEKINLLLDRRACAVVTGQQTGLFGGPLFTVYKALTAIKLAERLSRKCQGCFVPIFWLASDDHDFREVNHTYVPNKNNDPARIVYAGHPADSRLPVSYVSLTQEIGTSIKELEELTHPTFFKQDIVEHLKAAYQPGASFSAAFAAWLTTLFKSFGLILIDASDPEMKRLGATIFRKEVEEDSSSSREALAASSALQEMGYHNQVQLHRNVLNLFYVEQNREAVSMQDSIFHVKNPDRSFKKDELLNLIEREPQRFSPNVLLRPLFQDMLLPTVAYVAGPAETTYYAQMKGIYKTFGLPMPVIFPRKSMTLLETNVEKILDKYDLKVFDFWGNHDTLLNEILRTRLPQSLDAQMQQARAAIETQLGELRKTVVEFEPTLNRALENTTGKLMGQLQGMEKKVLRAYKKRNDIIVNHVYKSGNSLYPNRHLQEREYNIVPFLFKHGLEMIDRLYEAMDISSFDHQIIKV